MEIIKYILTGVGSVLVALGVQWLKNKPENKRIQDEGLKTLIDSLTKRVATLEVDITKLHQENEILRKQRIAQEEEIAQLRREIAEKGNYITTLKAYYEYMPAPAWMKDSNGIMTFINGAYEKTFGVSKLEYEGRMDEDVWGELAAKEFGKHDDRVLSKRKALRIVENVPNVNGKGSTEWVIWKFPIEHNGQLLIGGIAVAPKDTLNDN